MNGSHLVADHTVTTFGSSIVAVWVIEQLKKASWFPVVQQQGTAFAARALSAIAAAASTVGIEWQWMPANHSLLITGITGSAVLLLAWHLLEHFALQEWVYQSAVKKPQLWKPAPADENSVAPVGNNARVTPAATTGAPRSPVP